MAEVGLCLVALGAVALLAWREERHGEERRELAKMLHAAEGQARLVMQEQVERGVQVQQGVDLRPLERQLEAIERAVASVPGRTVAHAAGMLPAVEAQQQRGAATAPAFKDLEDIIHG